MRMRYRIWALFTGQNQRDRQQRKVVGGSGERCFAAVMVLVAVAVLVAVSDSVAEGKAELVVVRVAAAVAVIEAVVAVVPVLVMKDMVAVTK
jgi:hypothetical protein